jgi:signal transduction histidine kinase
MRKDYSKHIYSAVKGSNSIWARYQRVRHPKLYEAAMHEEKRVKMVAVIKGLRQEVRDLAASNAELAALPSEKDEFMGVMSHDLKSPFNGIIGFTDLLEEEISGLNAGQTLGDDQLKTIKDYLSQVSTASKHAFALLERFLEIYRINSGKLDFTPKNFDLSGVVAEQVVLLSANAGKKGIMVSSRISEGTTIFANPEMTGEVIGNLLSNAIKFTKFGGEISISCRAFTSDAIEVLVSDNGIGISKENQNQLLVVKNGLSTKGTACEKGTGFGIQKVREIVGKLGGIFRLESVEGKGTTCMFTLPLAEQARRQPYA